MPDAVTPIWVRTAYSMLSGTAMPAEWVGRARELGHSHLAMTDLNCLAGAPAFHKLAGEAGLRPIIGAELIAAAETAAGACAPLVALIAEEAGYANLCRFITNRLEDRKTGGPEDRKAGRPEDRSVHGSHGPPVPRSSGIPVPRYSVIADVGELQDGLLFLTEDPAAARELAGVLDGGRLWLALDPATQSDSQVRALTRCAEELGIPLAATGKALLAREDDGDLARLLAAIRLGKTFDTIGAADVPHPRAFLRGPAERARELADFPQAASENRRIVEMCESFRLLPRRPVFPRFEPPRGRAPADFLLRLCRVGLRTRYARRPPEGTADRLEKELALICKMGFCEYFLVLWDIVQYARRLGAPVAGRGSGASSLAAYLLGITNVCPLRYRIPFERFLHEGREDYPDLDVDFCWRLRDDVIDYVFRRWGESHAAMVSMHNTFQEASALREAAKAFGFSDGQISSGEAFGELEGEGTERKTEEETKEEKTRGQDARATWVALARRMVGMPHNFSVHPGGVVMAARDIDRYAPVQPAPKGVRITQYDKDGVEAMGLVKLDLLGNRNLSTVSEACELVSRTRLEDRKTGLPEYREIARPSGLPVPRSSGPTVFRSHGLRRRVDAESFPPDDPATVALLRSADTIGCNQLESPAMRRLLRMMQPAGTGDVMQALALIRPGAAGIGMKEAFIRRRRGLEKAPALPPALAGLLDETHGVMMYEDDVMQVAAALAGLSLGEADRFRKAIQKCPDDARRLELSRDFLSRCRRRGAEMELAKDLWVQMAKFNAYSFCRAHAASYGSIAYAGAYLKTHWPAEFWTAALNNNQGMYPPRVYVEEAKRSGVRFLLPDVNRSEAEFSLEGGEGVLRIAGVSPAQEAAADAGKMPAIRAIRVGLGIVEGLGPTGVERILRCRQAGPFEGLSDFLLRTGIGEAEARNLVLCGAFDWTGRSRPTLMMELNLFVRIGPPSIHRVAAPAPALVGCASRKPAHCNGPALGTGFPTARGLIPIVPVIPNVPGDYDYERKYRDERAILGLSVREHYLAFCRARDPRLAQDVDADSRDLARTVGQRVRLAGVVEARRSTSTQKGQTMLFLTMEDEWGLFEVSVFPGALARLRGGLEHYGPFLVAGTVEDQYGAICVNADIIRGTGNGEQGTGT